VKKVSEVEGIDVSQVIVGSSVNSSFRNFMVVAKAVEGRHCHPDVSFEINPGSSQVLLNVAEAGGVQDLILSGARIHQSGCLGASAWAKPPYRSSLSPDLPQELPGPERDLSRPGLLVLASDSRCSRDFRKNY
jgi:aconitate hydratase